ncbi:MAG TPA: MFS transporter [Streptosporangiaceae bacterium]
MPLRPDDDQGLWQNRGFRNLLIVQTLSALGDSFSYVAIPLLVLHTTGSVAQMGLVTGLTGAASIVSGVFSGVIADRVNRRALLMICDIARCILYAAIPLAWLFSPQLWLIYLAVPVAGVFAMLFDVTYVTVVPAIVEPGQITAANGRLYASFAIAGVAGPMLAGLVSGLYGPSVAIGVDASSFAVSAAGALFIRLRPTGPPAGAASPAGDAAAAGVGRARREFLAGAQFLWANPVLRTLTAALSVITFLTYGLTDLIVYDVEHGLHHTDSTVGYVLAAATVGTFAGSALTARIRNRLGFGGSWIGFWALSGLATACLGLVSSIAVVAVLAGAAFLCMGVAGICSMSLRQEITPAHLLGRVTAAFWTVHSVLGPVGAALFTAVAAGYGVTPVFLASGIGVTLTAVAAFLTPIWQPAPAQRLPDPG